MGVTATWCARHRPPSRRCWPSRWCAPFLVSPQAANHLLGQQVGGPCRDPHSVLHACRHASRLTPALRLVFNIVHVPTTLSASASCFAVCRHAAIAPQLRFPFVTPLPPPPAMQPFPRSPQLPIRWTAQRLAQVSHGRPPAHAPLLMPGPQPPTTNHLPVVSITI